MNTLSGLATVPQRSSGLRTAPGISQKQVFPQFGHPKPGGIPQKCVQFSCVLPVLGTCVRTLSQKRRYRHRVNGRGWLRISSRRSIPSEEDSIRQNPEPQLDVDDAVPLLDGVSQTGITNWWLPLGDLVVSSFLTPVLLVSAGLFTHLYTPLWLRFGGPDIMFLSMLQRGAVQAMCWFAGAFPAGALSDSAVNPKNPIDIVQRLVTSGVICACLLAAYSLLSVASSAAGISQLDDFIVEQRVAQVVLDLVTSLQAQAILMGAWRTLVIFAIDGQQDARGSAEEARDPISVKKWLDELLEPKIASPGLVFGDIFVAGVLVPGIQLLVLVQPGVYRPSWVDFGGIAERGIIAPALSHGALLAFCWVIGAWVTQAWARNACQSDNIIKIVKRTWAAGAVATFLLIGLSAAIFSTASAWSAVSPIVDWNFAGAWGRTVKDLVIDIQLELVSLSTWRILNSGAGPTWY